MTSLKIIPFILSLVIVGSLYATPITSVKSLDNHTIIPQPLFVKSTGGTFELKRDTKIQSNGNAEELKYSVQFLQDLIKRGSGFDLGKSEGNNVKTNVISLNLDPKQNLEEEEYILKIDKDKIHITAKSGAGIYNGLQTLRQLFPKEIEGLKPATGVKWLVPTGTIQDAPIYAYRGTMLDVSRHFFPVEDVKHFIDQIAKYKINKLHLHLSDDQGWRIEIKSWPLLTVIGGSTEVGGGEGGYYTQEQYKDIVAYAQSRYITIVPEIDMPGHTNSALASYGVLNAGITVPEEGRLPVDRKAMGLEEDPRATDLYTGMEVGFSTLDTHNEVTYKFVEDVIRELAEITPGPYIHIGGDESHVTEMEDYIPFIERIQELVSKYGKKTIGWDEVAHASLKETSIAQFWAKAENAKLAADQGAKVLMSPATHAYLDMQYDTTTQLGLHWAAYIEIDDAYNWEPTELVEGIEKDQILGVEAPLWTETITTRGELEFMVFPRLTAIAEVGWTPKDKRSWESYKTRLKAHTLRWDQMGINYYHSPKLD